MKLDKKFKKAWVEALLSGKYKQSNFYGECNGKCVLEVGAIVRFGTPKRWASVLGEVDDCHCTISQQFYELNDNDQVPFEIFAGVIDQWL